MPLYSKEGALAEREFELLLKAANEMYGEKQFETKFILVLVIYHRMLLCLQWVGKHSKLPVRI